MEKDKIVYVIGSCAPNGARYITACVDHLVRGVYKGYIQRGGSPSARDRLLATQNAIAAEKNLPMEGTTVRVLCDGESKGNPEVYSGRSEGGKIVFFHGTPDMVGQFVNIRIERTEAFALWGEIKI